MTDRLKLFPAVIAILVMTFGLKVMNIWTGLNAGLASSAVAQEAEEPTGEEAAPTEEGDPEGAAEGAAEAPAEGEGETAEAEAADQEREMSASEIAVLKSLAERREALEAREKDLAMQETLMRAAEARVEERISELKTIEASIRDLLGQRDAAEQAQIDSLVKVYEKMKPADAARIFETLEKDILLDVASGMKEQAIAGVLAKMNSARAQELTVMLASRSQLPETVAELQ
ncbi:MAG: hypothetical protein AAGC95_06970 [Pseudomonadota bacterium]